MATEIAVTPEGREAVEVEIAGAPHLFRFGMRTVLLLRRHFKERNPHVLVFDAKYEADEEALQYVLWACLVGEAERALKGPRRKDAPQVKIPDLDDVAELMQQHLDSGGEMMELATAVYEAWEIGGVNRKMAEAIKKKVAPALVEMQTAIEALTTTESSPSMNGSTPTGGPPSETAASA